MSFLVITLLARLYMKADVLHTPKKKHLHGRMISIIGDFWSHKTS